MASAQIVEAVDVFEDEHLGMPTGAPCVSPDQFSLERLEARFDQLPGSA